MAGAETPKSLQELLAEQLPKDVPFTFYHYSTPPSKASALFSAPPQAKPERTYCESHFLAASVVPKDAAASPLPEELLVLAIEVLVYSTKSLTTIFVSKADSTGFLAELQLPRGQGGSPLKAICGTFVAWLARERQREGKKLVVSLFARAQDQYLFPASIENKNKHVLDDRGLVKWWCRVLDPIVWQYKAEEERKPFTARLAGDEEKTTNGTSPSHSEATAKGYLVIPGFEPYDTLRYIPPSPVPNTPRRWATTHPLLQIAPHPAAPPRCLVPHFPDDPKARFLDELDEELPDRGTDAMVADGGTPSRSNGQWKSVKTLDQFWEFMAFRQECSSGRIVGFIWVVITPPQACILEEEGDAPSQLSPSEQPDSQTTITSTPPRQKPRRDQKPRSKSKPNTTHGPIPLILPRIKSSTSTLSSTSTPPSSTPTSTPSSALPTLTPYYTFPPSSRGTLIFSSKTYARAHELLLQQSFATRKAAARSTRKWREEIGVLGGREGGWGWSVVGRKEGAKEHVGGGDARNGVPTMLVGVRKKRKGDGEEVPVVDKGEAKQDEAVKMLDTGLVRKKVKVEHFAPIMEEKGVSTLAAGLVRKKPKV